MRVFWRVRSGARARGRREQRKFLCVRSSLRLVRAVPVDACVCAGERSGSARRRAAISRWFLRVC